MSLNDNFFLFIQLKHIFNRNRRGILILFRDLWEYSVQHKGRNSHLCVVSSIKAVHAAGAPYCLLLLGASIVSVKVETHSTYQIFNTF